MSDTETKTDPLAKARAAKAAKAAAAEETVEQKRARLIAELADLPAPENVAGRQPGDIVGEGPNSQKVPFTKRWFEDNTEMVEFRSTEPGQVILNGVKYAWKSHQTVRIPAPHYAVLEDSRKRQALNDAQYDPPTQLPMVAGQSSPIFRMGIGLMEPIPDTDK